MDGYSASLPLIAENHSPEATPQPTRKSRSDKGEIRLNPRDLLVLTWIGEQYAVRWDSLQVLLGRQADQDTKVKDAVGTSGVERVVERWKQENLVKSRKILANEPKWVWLTPHGLRQMGLPYKPNEPPAGQLQHRHLVNTIRLRIEMKYSDLDHWRSERLLRFEHASNTKVHIPDGELVLKDATVVAIEVERTLKIRARIKDIIEKLDKQYTNVWYFATPASYAAVESVTSSARNKFRLYKLEDFVK